jgi:hypothetical protein
MFGPKLANLCVTASRRESQPDVRWSSAVLFEVRCKTLECCASIGTRPASVLQIEADELLTIQKDDLTLIAADESDDVEFMQAR